MSGFIKLQEEGEIEREKYEKREKKKQMKKVREGEKIEWVYLSNYTSGLGSN